MASIASANALTVSISKRFFEDPASSNSSKFHSNKSFLQNMD